MNYELEKIRIQRNAINDSLKALDKREQDVMYYWSSSLCDFNGEAWIAKSTGKDEGFRYYGLPVRPVSE